MGLGRLLLALGVVAVVAALLWWRQGTAARDTDVVIPPGSSLARAAHILEAQGAIGSSAAFLTEARLAGGRPTIRPGEYHIARGMSAAAILELLRSGRVVQRIVVVPEGLPSVLVAERLAAVPLLTGAVAPPPEGSVLPDGYAYTRGESRGAVLARMQHAMQTAVANAWAHRSPRAAVTSPAQAVILASIIEKETARADERRMVAAVYSNRLRAGMPLQADPTVIYPVTRGRPLGRRILRSELDARNAYNTYAMAGLPAGPIANPSRASLLAAVDPAPSPALYFVAQPDGHSAFAATLDEHNRNKERWYAWRRSRGEM